MSDSTVTSIEKHDNIVLVHVVPQSIDEKNLSTIRAETSNAGLEAPECSVALDLSKVAYLPSLSLGGLVQLAREFKARNQRLILIGLQPIVREAMAITRLDRLFEIQDDVKALLDPTSQTK